MPKDLETTSPAKTLAKLNKLFGPAPVLSSEDLKAYDTIMTRFIECLKPRDFIEEMFVKDLTDSTWDIMRYRLHKTLVIEREHRQHQEMEEKRRQEEQKKKAAIAEWDAKRAKEAERPGDTKQAEPGEQTGAPTTQFERKLELERVIDGTTSDVEDILNGPAEELDHAEALQSGIDYFEQLDHLLSVAIARRNDTLYQIEFYGQGLGQHLRRVSDEIIDAEFSETRHEAPSLAGPGDAQ
jgi:hypothetical protein